MFAGAEPSYTVSELTIKLRDLIESQSDLQAIWVAGEVSNFSRPKSGHWYFTLKDEGAELRCVMWRGMAENQAYLPQDGDAIEVHGGVSVYEARGQYQLYADEIRPAGEGALYQAFLELKSKLEAEGLFDPALKQPLPERPNRIGVITSPTGAALRDILNTLERRYPLAEVTLAPAAVQGASAPEELIAALNALQEHTQPDVIILARGGGSLEDLAAFNDEALARAISASPIPIISGVGHETDFSISDFIADLRAPTPTAAAELATPDRTELHLALNELHAGLQGRLEALLQSLRWDLQSLAAQLERRSPQARILNDRQRVDDLHRRSFQSLQALLRLFSAQLAGESAKLATLNPENILQRGFSVVSDREGQVVQRLEQAQEGDALDVRVSDGVYGVRVLPPNENSKE